MRRGSRGTGWAVAATMALTAAADLPMASGVVGEDGPEGAYTCDFGVKRELLFEADPPPGGQTERDRMYMAARPGQLQKHDALSLDPGDQQLRNGGRYLFDTVENAEAYRTWMFEEFDLDGVLFFDRHWFFDPECRAWSVVGAVDLDDVHSTHDLMRTERWSVPADNQRRLLMDRWPQFLDLADERGLTGIWLLYNKHDRLVSFVYFDDRLLPENPAAPDPPGLAALAVMPSFGSTVFGDQDWSATFDRTQWMFFIWFPFVPGDQGEPSVWPQSPPLPEPFSGDTVCEPSRGENHANSPGECGPLCGNARPDEGETSKNCPGDVPFE